MCVFKGTQPFKSSCIYRGWGWGGGGGGFFSKESIWLSLLDFVVFPHRNYLVCFYRSTCIVELHPEKFISA